VALAGAAVAQPPDADRPAIRGGYGIELGSQLNAEELRRRGFRQDERYAPRWSKSHEGGELTVILPEMPDRANERISSISYSRPMTAEGNRDSNSICTARRTSELRRLMAAHPTLERREHNEESAESVTTRDYLVPRGSPPGRARARSITVECYTPRGDFAVRQGTAGRSTLFILFLDKQLRDAADAARAARPRSIPIDTSPGSSGAGLARTLEQFIRAQQELGWEELARRAAANYSYDWATVLIDNSVNDCERALAADRARLGACADLRLRSAGYARRAGRLIEAETDVRRAIQHFEALTPADPAGLGNAQILLADLLTDQGRYAEATAQARRALAGLSEGRLQLQNANAHAALARALWRRGEIDEAETQALRAVALLAPNGNTPVDRAWDHVRAASMLGGILADQGRWPEADAAHRGAVNLVHTAILFGGREGWPVAADAYAAYGEFELGRGRPAEAERIFRHALAVTRLTVGSLFTRSRATADAYHRLGLSLVAQGKHEEAEIQFRHAVGIRQFDEAESAEYAPHRIALANAWLARGSNPREA
jgi:tetratricopeptide (TPR) repeat protein